MARRNSRTDTRRDPFKVAILLTQFFLTWLGNLPLLLFRKLSISLPRGRGRPRKTPFISFYYLRFKKSLHRRFSQKQRVAIYLSAIFALFILYTFLIFATSAKLAYPQHLITSSQPLTTEIYDRSGKLLYRIYEGRNRTLVNLKNLPPHLIQATIATEDKNFYKHPGFDPLAIARALSNNLKEGRSEGASTITQQLIKNSLLTPEKTYARKIKEIILAFWAERIYSKQDILQMYLNGAPYGGPAWGIEAASQTYFGKSAEDLSLAEAAFLAGLPASPTDFSPYGTHPELAKTRQVYVLERMEKEGYISRDQKDKALSENLDLKPPLNNIEAPHFVFYIKDQLVQKYGERMVSQGGLKVTTTLDLDLQRSVEDIVKSEVDKLGSLNVKNGATMITDAKTGQILSMVGSRDYYYPNFGNFNVTLAMRQPGSSIKVITYATAFKKGFSPGNTVLDIPVSFQDEWGKSYTPVNYDGGFHGPVSIRQALGSSLNIPAVKMLATVGIDAMVQTAKDLGITTFNEPKDYGLSLTLGGADVRLIDMMSVYGTLSQQGKLNTPTGILKVTDSRGNVLEEFDNSPKQTLEPGIAYLITNILSDNKARTLAFGSSSELNVSPNVGVKTGTSDNKRDNWTFGYSSDFVVGVWVGNPDNSPMNPSLTSGVTGAAPIWNKITKLMLEKFPAAPFKRPTGIAEMTVDGRKDLALSGNIPKSLSRTHKNEDKIVFSDSFSSFATSSAEAKIDTQATN